MALNKREKNLATATVVLLVVAGLWFGYSMISGPMTTQRTQRETLQQEVDQKGRRVEAASRSQRRLDEYRRRSLPPDPELARSLYKNWLLELATSSGMEDMRVDPGEMRFHGDVYRVLPFSVNGRGTLDELTEFLQDFYGRGYLQKIRQLTIKPLEGSRNLELRISIEALSLPDAESQLELTEAASIWLADADRADYEVIGRRNLFAAYEPPRPPVVERPTVGPSEPPPPPPPSFDPSKYAFVTGITEEDGQPLLWLTARTTGEKYRLGEGESFEIGSIQCMVVEIHQRTAEIEVDGQRRVIPLGNSLHEPVEPPE